VRSSRGAALALAALLASAATHAQRLVSVGGAATEIVYALDAGSKVVGADSTSTFPHAANALPRVGYMRAISAEGVLSLQPDVVVAVADAGPPAAFAQLASAGVRVARLDNAHSIASVQRNARAVAAAIGAPARGDALAQAIGAEWAAVERELAPLAARPRALFLLAHGGGAPLVAGHGTAAHAMLVYAHAMNGAAALEGYKPLTAEGALVAAPDVIVVTREGLEALGGVDKLFALPGLALTPAGRTKRVVALDALELLGFGPRTPATVRKLARAIHAGG